MSLREKDATVVEIQADSGHHQQEQPKKMSRSKSQQQWDGRSMNSVSQIDRVSRVFFPILFVAINLFYWYTYIPPS